MRIRNNPKAQAALAASPLVIKSWPWILKKSDFLELGIGNGEMLLAWAQNYPQRLFIGIEKDKTVIYQALLKAETLKLKNVRLIHSDIINLDFLLKGKVKTIWITFPDPWPKKKHYKRRLLAPPFLKIYQKLLSPEGFVHLKTDNYQFWKWAQVILINFGAQLVEIKEDLKIKETKIEHYQSKYETKFRNLGAKIYYLSFTFT